MRYWGWYLVLFVGLLSWASAWGKPFTFEVAFSELEEIPRIETSPFVSIEPDRGNFGLYRPGDPIVLSLASERDGYVSVFDYSPQGEARILRNNEFFIAGSSKKIYGTVTGPEGTERFLMVLTPKRIPDRLLVEAMRRPTKLRSLLGEDIHVQHCAITVAKERVLAPSFLRFDRVPQEVAPGARVRLRVFLGDEVGNALVNRRIQWEVSAGKLDRYQTFTNTSGFSEVWYTAPALLEDQEVTIRASFDGDMVYGSSFEEARLIVRAERMLTVLELSPKAFHLGSGEVIDFVAVLQDVRGKPLEGETLRWRANMGSFEQNETVTDASGRARNRFFAPQVEAQESVEIQVFFDGTARFSPSQGYASGTVSGAGVYLGEGFYFLDVSNGKVKTNLEDLVYQGDIGKGFSPNPVFSLLLAVDGFVEGTFFLSQPLQEGALCLWGRAEDRGTLRVYVNGKLGFAGAVQGGRGGPLEVQIVSLAPFLELGKNTVRIEFEPAVRGARYALQRILVVF